MTTEPPQRIKIKLVDDEMAAWLAAAQPSLGNRVNWQRIADGALNIGCGASAVGFILDELTQRQLRPREPRMEFELLEWQEDVVRRMFGVDDAAKVADALTAVVNGPMYVGPVGMTSEQLTEQYLARSIWDEAPRTPRADPEMLNRVIDDISDDVEAKIARLQCPKFPRTDV